MSSNCHSLISDHTSEGVFLIVYMNAAEILLRSSFVPLIVSTVGSDVMSSFQPSLITDNTSSNVSRIKSY